MRRGDEANQLVAHATTQAGRGEFPDYIAAFAATTAQADNAVYGPMLLPPADLDPQRVEELRVPQTKLLHVVKELLNVIIRNESR
ncbi:hypothetical protein [Amycolatopsis sp. lyj-23]|uniref:hypothetical protein n=1 Tax=Amycolatopsis sp. lyj-23 TaxID=2789283 RepID=UPI0039796E17